MEKRLLSELEQISATLLRSTQKLPDISLHTGAIGTALALFHYGKYSEQNAFIEEGYNLLEESLVKLNHTKVHPTFSGGIIGIGWAIEYLIKEGFIQADDDINQFLTDIDKKTESYIPFFANNDYPNFDFLHGMQGVVYYSLYRNKLAPVKQYLDYLEKSAIVFDGSTEIMYAWFFKNFTTKLPNFNLGLSHGLSSIVMLLSKIVKKGLYPEQAIPLLKGATNFLMEQKREGNRKTISLFPNYAPIEEGAPIDQQESRLAWCYGDLGIGYALLHSAIALDNKELFQDSVNILKETTTRKDPPNTDSAQKSNTDIVDACICHGTAGAMLMYKKIFDLTQENVFNEATDYWLEQTLDLKATNYNIFLSGKYLENYSLLQGTAGILLALITIMPTPQPLGDWEACLLL